MTEPLTTFQLALAIIGGLSAGLSGMVLFILNGHRSQVARDREEGTLYRKETRERLHAISDALHSVETELAVMKAHRSTALIMTEGFNRMVETNQQQHKVLLDLLHELRRRSST